MENEFDEEYHALPFSETDFASIIDRILKSVPESLSRKIRSVDEGPSKEENRLLRFLNKVPKRLREATLENFIPPDGVAAYAVEKIRKQLAETSGTGHLWQMLLFGPPGTGKDHLAIATAKELAKMGVYFDRITGAELYRKFRDAMYSTDEEAILRSMLYPDVLILSDPVLGGTLTPAQQQQLYLVIDSRWSEDKPCWVTVNAANMQELEKQLGGQIVDRLQDEALVIHATWRSYRKAIGRRG